MNFILLTGASDGSTILLNVTAINSAGVSKDNLCTIVIITMPGVSTWDCHVKESPEEIYLKIKDTSI